MSIQDQKFNPASFTPPSRLKKIGPSQIRENMRIALENHAINLAQGRPDFPTSPVVKQAAIDAISQDHNQYSVTWGLTELRQAIAQHLKDRHGLSINPETEVTITCGVTEAIVASMLALVETDDEVVIIEPAHENYVPAVYFASGRPKFVTLRPPDYAMPIDELRSALSPRTRAIILNTPHNPSGHVFTHDELTGILAIADQHGIYVVTDEIYDHLYYEPHHHIAPATLAPTLKSLVITGGLSKIYAATGWRLGYVVASEDVTAAIRTVHDYLTICAPTPFQHAAVTALALPETYYAELRAEFLERRDLTMKMLQESGFTPYLPQGAYYLLAGYEPWAHKGNSESFTKRLITEAKVAVVPGNAFYYQATDLGQHLVRFAFAKTCQVLQEASENLRQAFLNR
ncbi:pyridoxal phosphate-dependent aminotransferase [Candidatus Nitronereus thalassa]|uniref:Aminotransferase n=1 Tax=Candidatus Nitronereus thalassa TaxID=3020898 RepID=A0ABU3KBW4_9BACT|nr:pyridoxal phosphate-dependent aminotransferase [Candidatus Nitronereus thalassa]MDT7043876.1 pyridoxal phosphate-dependent aminotransferase [Candidatus Nitronereus thalassa]